MQTPQIKVRSVCEQIFQVRQQHPNAVALSDGDRHLTYADLDEKAAAFAGYLVQLGVRRGGTVAICMERSFDWIGSALGIMRAGAAYVPLDLAWPDSRLRYALEDSGATVLVARAQLLDRLGLDIHGIDPLRDGAAIANASRVQGADIPTDSLAYVIYTSGSTGVPKGVEITHANLAHLISWHQEAFGLVEGDRASHLAGLGFDAAVWEIWPNLATGATLCLPEDSLRSSPELIRDWMTEEGITVGFVPTVHAAPMMSMQWPEKTALRLLLTGGDTLHHYPGGHLPFKVVNNYGPTECTVVATSSVLEADLDGAPPIGRAITGASVYLLDEQGKPVADGAVGEIYVGGGGVGHGYRNLPESTERSFVPDPFSGTASARMYRTGDCGVRRSSGEIEFHGRIDRQTKIRGQRVELDEISGVLARHPDVDFATTIASPSDSGENQLIAYVLPKGEEDALTVSSLQEHLRLSVPDYMVPAIFVRLDEIPLSSNGKLDLKLLPHPAEENLLERESSRVADTPIEEKLLGMVRQLLQNDTLEVQDNFFLAGGHSLLGMQLVMRLRSEFGVHLTLRQLFEAPSVDRLAVTVENLLIESIDSMSDEEAATHLTE